MFSSSTLRKFILGNGNFILSHAEYKRVLLTGQLCTLTFFFGIGFFLFDFFREIHHGFIYELSCAGLAVISFFLNRKQYHDAAKIILGFSVNFTVFFFSLIEPSEVGLYMYYIPASLGAIAVFGPEDGLKRMVMLLLPFVLFMASQVIDRTVLFQPVAQNNFDPVNLIITFTGSLLASVLIIHYVISINFRSEKSLLENEKQINEKNTELSKLNTELDQFVYSTSHDLMAPLSSIRGLILLSRVTEDPKEQREIITMMEGQVNNLQKFIRDISDYSRNTRLEVQKQKVLVNKLIRTILETLRSHPHTEKIKIELDIPADLIIYSDPARLQIILSNLIGNAIKYMDPGKETPMLKVSVMVHESYMRFIIQDNGLGIPGNHIHKIFDMFYQANEKAEGSGLGLYIVKQTVEKLNGTVLVASEFNLGTTFTVVIPVYTDPDTTG